jgi:hypothetical protein
METDLELNDILVNIDSKSKKQRQESKRIHFIHFFNIEKCSEFVNDLDKNKFKISHICCGGYGVGLLNIDLNILKKLEEKYL